LWDYEDCYKYEALARFDQMVQKACDLARRAFEIRGEEAWFKLLKQLDNLQSEVGLRLKEEQEKSPDSMKDLYSHPLGQDVHLVG
jgi:hypothetical protein